MALVDRAHAVNCKVLYKLWYKAGSIAPREADYKNITKLIKSWIYQDLFAHPSDQVLYRSTAEGGLGLIHSESHCQALLIRSFLESAINPKFKKSITNVELYRQKVLNKEGNFLIEFNPYYNEKKIQAG